MDKKKIKTILLWIGIILFEVTIFYFSNMNTYDSNNKSKILMSNILDTTIIVTNKIGLLEKLPTQVEKQAIIYQLNTPFRKVIHFGIYLILATLIINALNGSNKNTSFIVKLTIIICFFLALIDEYHQTFITGRTGSFKDVLIDTLGSITAVYIYYKNKKKSSYKNINI